MLFLRFKKEVENYISKGDKVIIAFSGGCDSIFLLEMFLKIKEEYSLKIELAYLNHNLRTDSKEEEHFVKKIAKEKALFLHKKSLNISVIAKDKRKSIEEIAREERYNFFEEISKNVEKVALAHHIDDNIETFLFRLIRGTSLKGLKSIPSLREKFIRPLLKHFYKEEILNYLEENKIEYFKDYTNSLNIYTRNKIRNELIPLLEQYNPKIKRNLRDLIEEANSFPEEYFNLNDQLNINSLTSLPIYNQKIILSNFLRKYVEISREKIENTLKILKKPGTLSLDIGTNKILRKSYNFLTVQDKIETSYNEMSFILNKEIKFNDYIIKAEIVNEISKDKAYYADLEKINLDNIKIRNRLSGDKFCPLAFSYTKKLKEYFIDKKIPKDLRNSIPLITLNSKIILIVGDKGSEEFKANKNTSQILKISFKKIFK